MMTKALSPEEMVAWRNEKTDDFAKWAEENAEEYAAWLEENPQYAPNEE